MSPILFALYIADWGNILERSGEGFKLGYLIISALLFADDLLVCSPKPEGLARRRGVRGIVIISNRCNLWLS